MSKNIQALLEYALDRDNAEDQDINFGNIPNILAQDINRETGVAVRGAVKTLSCFGIRHAVDTHGDHAKENERGQGQIGIVEADFLLIPSIIGEPDSFERGHDKKGKKSVVFIKRIGSRTYYVVMSITKDAPVAKFMFNTMYIKK